MFVLIALIALAVGLLAGWLIGKATAKSDAPEISRLQALLDERDKAHQEKVADMQAAFDKETQRIEAHNKETLRTLENQHAESLKALEARFDETAGKMREQLRSDTEDILRQRQEEFAKSSTEKIDVILKPLHNSLSAMQEKVTENTARHNELGGKLSESIRNLLSRTESAQASADRLADMLKGNTRYQGSWGERILQEILETLNLKEGIHFETQKVLTDEKGHAIINEEGRRMKPDVILHLDQNKDVIIDSKVSLTGYLKYMEAETDPQREDALREHIISIENHVKELARKDYSAYVAPSRTKMGYVIMFVPNTSALLLATSRKPTLWRDAMEKNVYIADEQTLYAALKIVSLTWQQIAQTENHKKVYDLANEMMTRVGAFMKAFTDIGASLDKAAKSYSDGLRKLEPGGQSIPTTCRKLIDLGAKVPKIPKGVDPQLLGLSDSDTQPDAANSNE